MSGALGIGVLVSIVANAVVGARLIHLSLRTRRLPEFAIGSALLLLGGVGYPLAIAARNGVGGPEGAPLLLAAALGIQNLGAVAMAVATWRTFRAGDEWARALCAGFAVLLVGSWLIQGFIVGFTLAPGVSATYWLGFAGRALPFAWSAAESWRYYAMLQRRERIGLPAEPAVMDRFRLWAISATGVSAGFALFGAAAVAGIDVSTSAWVLGATSLVGCISGVAFWLAFLPPRRYLSRFTAPA